MLNPAKTCTSLLHEVLAYELRKTLFEVPYSSVSQFYTFVAEQDLPRQVGLSCVWQSYHLGESLRRKHVCDVSYLLDGRHVAVLCHADGQYWLLDPYLLHTTPLALGDLQSDSVVEAPAYPFRNAQDGTSKPSRLKAEFAADVRQLRLTYTRYSPVRGFHVTSRYFSFALEKPAPDQPPPGRDIVPLLFHPEQNNLSVRIVSGDDHRLHEVIYPLALHADAEPDPSHLLVRDNAGRVYGPSQSPHYSFGFQRVARALRFDERRLRDFMLDAVAIYRRHAPPGISYPPYVIKDE